MNEQTQTLERKLQQLRANQMAQAFALDALFGELVERDPARGKLAADALRMVAAQPMNPLEAQAIESLAQGWQAHLNPEA